MYVSFVGKLFLRMLKAVVIPLIVPSLITAVGSLNISLSGLVGRRTIAYFLLTTFAAAFLGLALVVVIHPGGNNTASEARIFLDGSNRNQLQIVSTFSKQKINNTS